MGPLDTLVNICIGAIVVAFVLGAFMAEHDRRFYKKLGIPLTRGELFGVAMLPSFIWIPAVIILVIIAFAPTPASAAELKRVPAGAANLIVQPDTHFDVTCADGAQLGIVTDGASAGSGYCAPLTK